MSLGERFQALVAVGASVSANCQPCLERTVARARESGADEGQITEAMEIGRRVRRGAASKLDQLAAGLRDAAVAGAVRQSGDCGCAE